MGVGRAALLWASQSPWLRRRVPALGFVQRAVRRFMPGETADEALVAARRFAKRGLPTTFTHLGENVENAEEAEAVVAHYLDVLDRIAGAGVDTEISVKLTHLGFDLDPDLAFRNLERLVLRAGAHGNWVWVDMEASAYVEGTVEIYERALATSPHVGLCLQAYLHRTMDDIERLLPLTPSVRLVKGAYREPPEVAVRGRDEVSRAFVEQSERLLRALAAGGVRRFAAATHDLHLLERVDGVAAAAGLDGDAYEIQMLYGIRQEEQFRLAAAGRPTRCLIAYGPAWYPWYMRRLAERPANVGFVLRNLFARGG